MKNSNQKIWTVFGPMLINVSLFEFFIRRFLVLTWMFRGYRSGGLFEKTNNMILFSASPITITNNIPLLKQQAEYLNLCWQFCCRNQKWVSCNYRLN